MLELALLGLLKEHPMHGYDLRKRLREDVGLLANLSFGSLYPALARLEASGAVRALSNEERNWAGDGDEDGSFLPLTGSISGERAALVARRATAKAAAALGGRGTRARKVYEITARGEELFEQLLESSETSGEDARTFSVRLTFARHLGPSARQRLLERRRIQLADRLRRASQAVTAPTRPLDRYERAVAEHARELAALDLSFVEELLEQERRLTSEPAPLETTTDSHLSSTNPLRSTNHLSNTGRIQTR